MKGFNLMYVKCALSLFDMQQILHQKIHAYFINSKFKSKYYLARLHEMGFINAYPFQAQYNIQGLIGFDMYKPKSYLRACFTQVSYAIY